MSRRLAPLLALALSACSTCSSSDDEDKEERTPPPAPTASDTLLDRNETLTAGQGAPGRVNYDVPVQSGDHVTVTLESSAFDPVLEVTPPGSGTLANDDFEGSRERSQLSVVVAEPGILKVTVTSLAASAAGGFHVVARRGAATQGTTPVASTPLLTAGQSHEGTIDQSDGTLADGRFQERLVVSGADAGPLELRIEAAGDQVPLAIVMSPAGQALSPSGSGVYAIASPGPHRVQLIAPTAGQPAGYRVRLDSTQQATTPTLSRSHHQLPTGAATASLSIGAVQNGNLGGGGTLPTGEPADLYTLTGQAGQQVRIELSSSAFDPYLMLLGPTGRHWENDDSGGTLDSAIELALPASGAYRVVASAYRAGMSGAYELKVSPGGRGATPQLTTVANPQPAAAAGAQTRSGELAEGDETLDSGELFDRYTFVWGAGTTVDLQLTSSAFDTYLIVRAPGGDQEDNDDVEQGNTNSGLTYTASAQGAYTVLVTSYRPGETGAYELSVTPSGAAAPTTTPAPSASSGDVTRGELAQGDATLQSGELSDVHTMTFQQGERVHLEARSTAFDTYLIVRSPSGHQQDNDDGPNGTNAALDFVATESGEYRVTVTSYRPGETGAYELVRGTGAALGTTPAAPDTAPATAATGATQGGDLAQGDPTLDSGEFVDTYTRTFEAGASVQIRLSSSAFDPYLIVRSPSGRQMDNDDLDSSTRNAGVDIPAAEPGEYRVLVTSYRPGETGAYELSFGAGAPIPRPSNAQGGSQGGGRVFGLFAGITDYPAGVGDLPECANDAIKLAEALREGGLLDEAHQILLTDAQATTTNVRAGMQRLAAQMGPSDIFVFFYSGHGGQTQNTRDDVEIDGRDEYLVLHDGPLLDDEMGRLFEPIRAGVSVMALDACFSGGFAKDVITRPGRVGLFSSEEDVLSAVAGQFQAGGYLSHFMRTAVSGEADMSPRDRVLTVGELTHYLYTQFGRHATDVQLQGAYQHLVVDRGAVRVDQVLWAYR